MKSDYRPLPKRIDLNDFFTLRKTEPVPIRAFILIEIKIIRFHFTIKLQGLRHFILVKKGIWPFRNNRKKILRLKFIESIPFA